MNLSVTLIQLVSEQTMQNLLPALRLKPQRLIHLATPRTANRSALIAEAARQSQCAVELETITLSTMPGIKETMSATLAAIERAAQQDATAVVNFTGGTKLMSLGAYVAALKHKTVSLYVDTQDALFVDGQTGAALDSLLDGDLSFTPILRSLSVNAVAVANGCRRVTGGRDWQPLLPLAEHLFAHPQEEEHVHDALHGANGLFPYGREPCKPSEWVKKLDQPLALPETCRDLAVQAGLVRPGPPGEPARLPDSTRADLRDLAQAGNRDIPQFAARCFKAVAPMQRPASFLTGGWWEVIIADRMQRCGRFRDLRWSVQIGEAGGPDLEEDIVALEGVQAVYVSCKRGGGKARLLPLLDEINARARSLGGAFTRRFLAVKIKPYGRVLRNLTQRADELGVCLLFPEHLAAADPFG
jgi:hypothetical protein